MKPVEEYNSVAEFVDENREMLERVLQHSNSPYARACAWALIDAGSDAPDIVRLKRELEDVKEAAYNIGMSRSHHMPYDLLDVAC